MKDVDNLTIDWKVPYERVAQHWYNHNGQNNLCYSSIHNLVTLGTVGEYQFLTDNHDLRSILSAKTLLLDNIWLKMGLYK